MTGAGNERNAALLEYLGGRRWFGEKGARIRGARIADSIPVTWRDSSERFVVARARVEGDIPAYYQLFLRDGDASYTDALEDETFRRGLVDAFAAGCTFDHAGLRWVIQSETDAPFKVPADARIRPGSAEQSNTSLFVGSQAVLKLFRKVAPGVHPDIEVTRFLTIERRFLHAPALLGSIHFIDAQGPWAAGMLQELVPGAVDAWSHALECARPWFASGAPEDAIPFSGEAERLGAITREMHDALASGDKGSPFERLDADARDLDAWAASAVATMRRAMKSAKREADADAMESAIRDTVKGIERDAGAKIRVHGDYHLGQVLRSVTNAFLIVDFEGEPARPLEERRTPQSPLRDVAGMLRSFAYAAATLGKEQPGHGARWEQAMREAFLRGYFGTDSERDVIPRSRANADRLIRLFEVEKAFYELQYEIDHRPDWAWIPLRAIETLQLQIPRFARDDRGSARDDRGSARDDRGSVPDDRGSVPDDRGRVRDDRGSARDERGSE